MDENTAKECEQALYTTSRPDAVIHTCAVVFDGKHAVSFRHGLHSSLVINDRISLFNVENRNICFETFVSAISDSHDLIILKLQDGVFPHFPRTVGSPYRGQKYIQLGVDAQREPMWKDGIISARKLGFFVGTSHGKFGDSGSAIFESNGRFLGLSIGKKDFAFSNLSNMHIGEIADHHPDTQIISADSILAVSGVVGTDFKPPAQRLVSRWE